MKNNNGFLLNACRAIVFVVLLFCGISCKDNDEKNLLKDHYVTFEFDGKKYTMEAVPGQVVVNLSPEQLSGYIRQGYRIEDEIESAEMSLLYVGNGNEGKFIAAINDLENGIVAFPNVIYYPKGMKVHIMDEFKTTEDETDNLHGDMVKHAYIQAGGLPNILHTVDVQENGKISSFQVYKTLEEIMNSSSNEDSMVINMSFGPALEIGEKEMSWTDLEVTDDMRDSYVMNYKSFIYNVLNVLYKYHSNDVVVVMAAGNEGLPNFQEEVLDGLRMDLLGMYPLKYYHMNDILDKSIIFVSAKDDECDEIYANGASDNEYHPLITKVDISDWKYSDGKHYSGTSFAAPTMAAMISDYSVKYNLSVEETLMLLKNITKATDDQVLSVTSVADHFKHPPMVQILQDMEGKNFFDLFDIEAADIVDASIVSEVGECDDGDNIYRATLALKLSRYEIQIDAHAKVEYRFDKGIWTCVDLSFSGDSMTAKDDYSSYVEIKIDCSGFMYGYSVFNNSDMDLWVKVEKETESEKYMGVVAVSAHDRTPLTFWGTSDKYKVLSAYKAEGVKHPFLETGDHKIGIIAHRGFWNCEEAGYAKNSIAALRCAQEQGFWGSEFDVNMTEDGVLIVYHDSYVDGKAIEKHPYSEFKDCKIENGEVIPTVDMFLEQGKKYPETMLVYELKSHSNKRLEARFVKLTIEKLKEYDMLDPDRVMFISFSRFMCDLLAQRLPDFTVQYLSATRFEEPEDLFSTYIDGIDISQAVLNHNYYNKAKELGMSVNVWTVDDEEDIKDMLNMKVDQITTDVPLYVRTVMSELGYVECKR